MPDSSNRGTIERAVLSIFKDGSITLIFAYDLFKRYVFAAAADSKTFPTDRGS